MQQRLIAASLGMWLLAPANGIAAPPPEVIELFRKASDAAAKGDSAAAILWTTQIIEQDPTFAPAYRVRGRERFRQGKILEAIRDQDRFVELRPQDENQQWERGIAYFYAGQYEKGAKQFELYQTYHNSDVENSVWRFLCMVPQAGIEKARSAMLPIRHDPRIPMMQIYDLYRGKLQPKDVLEAAQAGEPGREQLAGRLFYAHLYLALYYDATGDRERAAQYIRLAAADDLGKNPLINHYMWDVARIHAARLPRHGAGTE